MLKSLKSSYVANFWRQIGILRDIIPSVISFIEHSSNRGHKPPANPGTTGKENQMSYLTSLFRRTERKRVLSELLMLDDHLLRDIGLTRSDVSQMRAARHHGSLSRSHE